MTAITSQLLQETTVDRILVCNGFLQFYEESLYNFVKYCENLLKNAGETTKKICGYWDWYTLLPFIVLPPMFFAS